MPLTDVFNVMPGLVVDLLGEPAVVTETKRNHDTEVIQITLNTPNGDVHVPLNWSTGQQVNIIGLAVDCQPDNIDLFEA